MTRRDALLLLGALASAACRGRDPVAPATTGEATAKLDPISDLVPAAGLLWLMEARMRELLASPVLIPAVATLLTEDRLDSFAQRHGGVDLRRVTQLVVAGYPDSTLALARDDIDPARVEAAFAARAVVVEGRAVEGGVSRLWGSVGHERQQVAVFGREAVGLERGRLGPLRASIYFAQGKLKRASPALRAQPLSTTAALIGDAPLRLFAPGPFEGAWARGLGGLLRATTAVAASLHPRERAPNGAIDVHFVLTGAWGSDANEAAGRLEAAFRVLADDPLARLMGIDRPLEAPRVSADAGAIGLALLLDPLVVARGLHAATDAQVTEIMAY